MGAQHEALRGDSASRGCLLGCQGGVGDERGAGRSVGGNGYRARSRSKRAAIWSAQGESRHRSTPPGTCVCQAPGEMRTKRVSLRGAAMLKVSPLQDRVESLIAAGELSCPAWEGEGLAPWERAGHVGLAAMGGAVRWSHAGRQMVTHSRLQRRQERRHQSQQPRRSTPVGAHRYHDPCRLISGCPKSRGKPRTRRRAVVHPDPSHLICVNSTGAHACVASGVINRRTKDGHDETRTSAVATTTGPRSGATCRLHDDR